MSSVVGAVIAREYLQRVRTRTFLVGTIGLPLLMLALFVVSALMAGSGGSAERSLALVDRTGVLESGVAARLAAAGFEVESVEPGSVAEEELESRLLDGSLGGALFLESGTLEVGSARLRGVSVPSLLRRIGIQQAVSQTALEVRLVASEEGPALAALLSGGELHLETVGAGREDTADEDGTTAMVAGFAGAFLLYVVLLVYGTMVLRAVLEEKTGRIAEIILSSMRPGQLMLGKIVGVGAVGLTQLAAWILFGAILLGTGIPAMLPFFPEGGLGFDLRAHLPGAGVFAFFGLCFLVGYFLYASLFAAVGAMCSTEEEAQQLQFPVVMLVVVPIVFLAPVLDNPTTSWAMGLSLFPFFSPILMFARVAAGAAPVWEAALSVVLMLATLMGTAWVAGRIYRTGILMQGKRPTLPELWRWVRYG
ncbi:MAG: ABC transporter permease [Gemmatimonadales bacterium]|nr:MAG: ABC transporter permease [Gemmatimonadales bacterium]